MDTGRMGHSMGQFGALPVVIIFGEGILLI